MGKIKNLAMMASERGWTGSGDIRTAYLYTLRVRGILKPCGTYTDTSSIIKLYQQKSTSGVMVSAKVP